MHSYLIVGGTQQNRQEKIKEILGDISEIITLENDKTISIEDIRDLQRQLSFAQSEEKKGRGVIIYNAHLATAEASQAFLKTLEEPQGNTTIILTAPSQNNILETIKSRMTIYDLGEVKIELDEKSKEIFEMLLIATVGKRLEFGETINDRGEAIEFCVQQIAAAREKMLKNPGTKFIELLEKLDQTRVDLENNTNVKLTIAELLLNY